ncbi:MAG: hypothetical protein GVY13_16785 [Alphaproteobacteria bacterium]|jgi:S-adenosylmethionine hydrolase|nr:hypothetical protein [Alphaproteobacteria bacterium]
MILLFTDFGWVGPYVGQVKTVLADLAPGYPVIDLMHDAPAFSPKPSSYLLAALTPWIPRQAVVLAVVDPGVGTARRGLVVRADQRWYVGPDNGLFDGVIRRAGAAHPWEITLSPTSMARTFHGRDLFAPVAARIAFGASVPGEQLPESTVRRPDWPDDLAEVIYIDGFGNAMTGIRAESIDPGLALSLDGRPLRGLGTFGEAEPGETFWYANSLGLAEIALRDGSAAARHGLTVGAAVKVVNRNAPGPGL